MDSVNSSWIEFFSASAGLFVILALLSFLIGLVLVPIFITRIPADYFSYTQRSRRLVNSRYRYLRPVIMVARNLFGVTLIVAGLVMLFIPGQGLLTLLIGLMVTDFPGKYRLERWLVERPHVLPAMNWLRKKNGRPPLAAPHKNRMKRS